MKHLPTGCCDGRLPCGHPVARWDGEECSACRAAQDALCDCGNPVRVGWALNGQPACDECIEQYAGDFGDEAYGEGGIEAPDGAYAEAPIDPTSVRLEAWRREPWGPRRL